MDGTQYNHLEFNAVNLENFPVLSLFTKVMIETLPVDQRNQRQNRECLKSEYIVYKNRNKRGFFFCDFCWPTTLNSNCTSSLIKRKERICRFGLTLVFDLRELCCHKCFRNASVHVFFFFFFF